MSASKTNNTTCLSIEIGLTVNPENALLLEQTMQAFNTAATYCSQKAVATKATVSNAIQRLFYKDLRERFGLSAQHACLCCKEVASKFTSKNKTCSAFRVFASIPFDARTFTLSKDMSVVSLTTLAGRIKLNTRIGSRQAEQLSSAVKIGEARLIRSGSQSFSLRISCFVPAGQETSPTDWIGVDLGLVNLATDSDGNRYSGAKIECVRTERAKTRSRLQQAAQAKIARDQRPKNIRRKLARLAGKEARYMKDVNHCISKKLVAGAQGTGRGIALEDLTGIRDRNRLGKQTRTRVNKWAFAQFRSFVVYKALLAGVEVVFVDPRNTSRECSKCGNIDKCNRKTQAEFRCLACGHKAHADKNAADVIRKRAVVNRPRVSRPA